VAKTTTVVPAAETPKPLAVKTTTPKTAPAKTTSLKMAADASGDTTAKPVKLAKATVTSKTIDAEIPTGAPVVQIGAFSSEALAIKGWSDVATLMPGKMAGKSRKVEMANVNGKTFYRGFVGGFASKSAAQAFCASLTAAGKGCIVR
jgi:cell division protein FtsN